MTTTNTSSITNPTLPQNTTFKLLPTSVSIRKFSGSELGYIVRDCISLCEDVMKYSVISDGDDQISFVRVRLQPASRASHIMEANSFTRLQETKDYPTFRSNFLETFGENAAQSSVKALTQQLIICIRPI